MGLAWTVTDNNATIGQTGSENGVILLDEEYEVRCRITLEENGDIAPYSITCGVYGLMVHTAFASNRAHAEKMYQNMKNDLEAFLDSGNTDSADWCESFTNKW